MEALNTNTGNLLTTLVVITSLTVSSPRAINPGNSIKNQVVYNYISTSVIGQYHRFFFKVLVFSSHLIPCFRDLF